MEDLTSNSELLCTLFIHMLRLLKYYSCSKACLGCWVQGLNVLNTSLQPSWKFRFPSLPGFLSHQLLQAMPMLCLCWQCRASWAGFELASEIEVVLLSQHSTAPSQGTATSSCTYLLLRGDEWFHPVQCNDIISTNSGATDICRRHTASDGMKRPGSFEISAKITKWHDVHLPQTSAQATVPRSSTLWLPCGYILACLPTRLPSNPAPDWAEMTGLTWRSALRADDWKVGRKWLRGPDDLRHMFGGGKGQEPPDES